MRLKRLPIATEKQLITQQYIVDLLKERTDKKGYILVKKNNQCVVEIKNDNGTVIFRCLFKSIYRAKIFLEQTVNCSYELGSYDN